MGRQMGEADCNPPPPFIAGSWKVQVIGNKALANSANLKIPN